MCYNTSCSAGVAHPVERHLAKVEVASSSLVTRSNKKEGHQKVTFFFIYAADRLENKIQLSGGQLIAAGWTAATQ